MPRPTFFNLPEAKRQHIFQHALVEFARHPYEQASLSEIVNQAGIAKGSMYQYFADKKELFKYVIQQVYKHKRDFLQSAWNQDEFDFFALINRYYRQSWQYARLFPLHHQVIANFWDSKDSKIREEILRERQLRHLEFFDLLEQGIKAGQINPRLAPGSVWFVFHAVGRALIDNFIETDVESESHSEFISSVLAVLEQGLRLRKEQI